jgi:adenylate cyclase
MKISKKYPVFLLLTTLGTAAAIFFALLGVLQTSLEKELTNRGDTAARAFADANAPLLLADDRFKLKYALDALARNDISVVNAFVADAQGAIVASLDPKQVGTQLPDFLKDPKRDTWEDTRRHAYHFREMVRFRDVPVGTFVLSLSRVPVENAIERATRYALLFVAGIAAVIAIFIVMLVRREVRPLTVMSHVMQQIMSGDFSRRVSIARKDEIGELADAMNQMLVRSELFFHYVDKGVIERLAADPTLAQPGGREQVISVLFGDMRGYTAMSNRRSPNQVVRIVNTYFHLYIECIAHFRGIVDKTMGDAIMSVFEKSETEEGKKARERAALCLAYMKAASRTLNFFLQSHKDAAERMGMEPREWGFAMATGPAIVGNIGSRRHMNYTVCGRVVNLASRLEGLTKSGEVIIDNFTRYDTASLMEVETLAPVQPKGFTAQEKVIPHRITALSDPEMKKLRAYLKSLFSYAFVQDMLVPTDMPPADQHTWATQAEKDFARIAAETPTEAFFSLADTTTGEARVPQIAAEEA